MIQKQTKTGKNPSQDIGEKCLSWRWFLSETIQSNLY